MKIIYSFCVLTIFLLGALEGQARDTHHLFKIADAISTADAKAKIDKNIQFVFGTNQKMDIEQNFGEFMSNKKTNAFNKSDLEACQRAFLSALLSFQDRAKKMGGDATVNITSFYKKHPVDSATEYECGAGTLMAGVTLKGEVVKLKKK